MPSLTYLPFIIGRGARLATIPIFLPIKSSGANHLAMPDRMQRSRSPSKTVRCSSFLLSFMRSQARTSATRSSTLQKSSKLISASWSPISSALAAAASAFGSSAGALAAWAAAFWAASKASSSTSSLAVSIRGKMFSPLCRVALAGIEPTAAALSQVFRLSSTPNWAKIFSQVSGINGWSSTVQTRSVSARLYSTRARRGLVSSLLASTQGAVASMYLLALSITSNTSARAFWNA